VPVKQILIETRLATVDSDFERELGLHFSIQDPLTAQQSAGHYSLAVARLADGALLDIKLSAMENAGRAELISNPSLFTANQQPASIEAGEEIPYQETSRNGATTTVFKKAVLSLKVTPQIMPDETVLLQLQVNQDKPSNKMVQGVPTISTRQIMTNVLIKNGQTVVLGGIYEMSSEQGEEKLPIPLLDLLFREKNVKKRKRELLVFVTPRIMT